jgi:two-component system, NarL family, nitrate/nitrite response regulator NarL
MSKQMSAEAAGARLKQAILETDASDLGEQIAGVIAACPTPARATHHADGRIEELLLDTEIDGARYTLTRSYAADADMSLSPREREIARLVAKGLPNKTIGAVLGISSWTVATHLRRIFTKLSVPSRAAMVATLAENGDL